MTREFMTHDIYCIFMTFFLPFRSQKTLPLLHFNVRSYSSVHTQQPAKPIGELELDPYILLDDDIKYVTQDIRDVSIHRHSISASVETHKHHSMCRNILVANSSSKPISKHDGRHFVELVSFIHPIARGYGYDHLIHFKFNQLSVCVHSCICHSSSISHIYDFSGKCKAAQTKSSSVEM